VSTRIHWRDAAIAVGLIALAIFVAVETYRLPDAPGYAQVGPRLFPGLIAAGLLICGLLLSREALSGGFHKVATTRSPVDWAGFLWVSGGVIIHMATIGWVGFIVASTVLFACVARAFGSRRPARDVVLGVALGTVTFVVFTQGLGLPLPAGLLAPRS